MSRLNVLASPLYKSQDTIAKHYKFQRRNSLNNQRQQTELSPAPTEETSVTINKRVFSSLQEKCDFVAHYYVGKSFCYLRDWFGL